MLRQYKFMWTTLLMCDAPFEIAKSVNASFLNFCQLQLEQLKTQDGTTLSGLQEYLDT